MAGEFTGKVALVTGASGGIGYACAHLLASRGASVALLDLADTTAQAQQLEEIFGVWSHPGLSTSELAHATQPSGKMGKPEEVAELICFLLSERAEFMTGSIVAIDGGTTIAGFSNGDASGAFIG